jgi:UDP-N-acetylmuramate--alanine ligase
MSCYEWRVGVSGSHGKSTVTAMIGKIFSDAGLSPTVLSGARLYRSKLPFSIGALDYLVYEACEYKDSFLSFSPTVAVFLNMELDHTDYFRDEKALASSFLKAMARAETVIVNRDDSALYSLAERSGRRVISYGASYGCDYRYETISAEAGNIRFRVFEAERELGEVCLSLLGEFNVSNATAAIAAAREVSVEFSAVAKSLSEFCGIQRRLEGIGNYKGRALYYDYAHHPTEIKASISAVRGAFGGKVTVIFRPHTYSRTAGLWEGFKEALSSADFVILLDIDAVREREIAGVSSERLAGEIGALFLCVEADIDNLLSETEGAIILMGAAELSGVKKRLTNET